MLLWAHHDTSSDGIDADAARAWKMAKARTLTDLAMFRVWLASMGVAASRLSPTPPTQDMSTHPELASLGAGAKLYAAINPATRPVELDIQKQLIAGIITLATSATRGPAKLPTVPENYRILVETVDAGELKQIDAPPISETAQIGVLEAIVIIAVSGVVASAFAWVTGQAAEVIGREITADEKKQTMMGAMTVVAGMIESHKANEAALGHTVEYDAQEIATLQTLRAAVKDTAAWEPPPLTSVPDVAAVTQGAGHALGNAGTGFGIGATLLGGWALYEFFLKPRRRAA